MRKSKQNKSFSVIRLGLTLVSICIGLVWEAAPVNAATSSTSVTELLSPGLLLLTSAPTAVLGGITLNGGNSQAATGSLGLLTVTDARGTSPGWSLTATTTPFTRVANPVQIIGSAGTLITGGNYTSATAGTYTVTIVAGGILGTATYSVSGLETQATTATGIAVPLGTRGLTLTFGSATYTVGEQWTVEVDTIPANNLTITPSAATAVAGSASGVSAGSAYTYSTGSDPATIVTASSGAGSGIYTDTPNLSLAIPAGSKAGTYGATVTETVN